MVSKNNTRTLISLPKDLKIILEQLAQKENRSLNNYIVTIIKKHIALSNNTCEK